MNVAELFTASASTPAAMTTSCGVSQFDGSNVNAPPFTALISGSPVMRLVPTVTLFVGCAFSDTPNVPVPPSNTLIAVAERTIP